MKTITIENLDFSVTKKEIKKALISEKQFILHLNYYCSDFFDVLILSSRYVDFKDSRIRTKEGWMITALVEKIEYIYNNIEKVINNTRFHLRIVDEYFSN